MRSETECFEESLLGKYESNKPERIVAILINKNSWSLIK